MPHNRSDEFHGYVKCLAVLKDGRTVRILGGEGLKLFVRDLDDNLEECYHDNIETIWTE
jgi:hypothetical protein